MTVTVWERAKLAREKRGLTQRTLGLTLGASSGYVSRLENGAFKSPGIEKVRLLAKALRVPFKWLAFGGPEPKWGRPRHFIHDVERGARVTERLPADVRERMRGGGAA